MAEQTPLRLAPAGPAADSEVAEPLLAYLRRRLDAPTLTFAEPPSPIRGGFDTSIYAFALNNAEGPYSNAMIARVFRTPVEAERARYEAVVQNAVASLGYPAPEVLLVESLADVLGGPFIIMRRLPGRAMLHFLLGPRMGTMAALLGRWHARLHGLDPDEFRRLIGDAVDPRHIATVDDILKRYEESVTAASLDTLRPALRWLFEHRPAPSAARSICHGDFHPSNVLVMGREVTGVVDWARVAVAEPAFDVGASVALLTHGPVSLPRPVLPLVRAVRHLIVRRYLRAYASDRALDLDEVRYYEAFRLFAALCEVAEQMQAADRAIAYNMLSPFFEPHVRRGVLNRLRSITRTAIALPDTA